MDDAKIWKVLVNHDPIVVVGDVIVLQEKIEPLFSSPCFKKKIMKIAIMQKKHLLLIFNLFLAAALKGSMTYTFTHMGNFLLLLLLSPSVHPPLIQILASRPKSQSRCSNPIFKAQIPPSRLGLRPHG